MYSYTREEDLPPHLWKEINRMHSSQIIENVAHDLIEGGTYSSLTIRHAIDSLNRALVALHNEEIIETIKEWA